MQNVIQKAKEDNRTSLSSYEKVKITVAYRFCGEYVQPYCDRLFSALVTLS